MSGVYSFIKHPIVHLLEISGMVVTGIEKCIALYFDEGSDSFQGKVIHKPSTNNLIEDLHFTDIELVKKLRMQAPGYNWQTSNNLPFETPKNSKIQLDIFDEYENVILCLSFPCESMPDQVNLVYLYLNKNKANFGIASSDTPLNTKEKSIIGQLTYNSFKVFYSQALNDRMVLKQTNERGVNLQSQNESLQKELFALKNAHKISKLSLAQKIIQELSQSHQLSISFDASAKEKISNCSASIDELRSVLEASVLHAINTKFGLGTNSIELNEWDIEFSEGAAIINVANKSMPERYHKTLQLLDKLENAAKIVVENNHKLTSENVGNACPTPISAPAISDALKNHHKKVQNLLNDYPDRWPLIKNEFRPVKNILLSSTA